MNQDQEQRNINILNQRLSKVIFFILWNFKSCINLLFGTHTITYCCRELRLWRRTQNSKLIKITLRHRNSQSSAIKPRCADNTFIIENSNPVNEFINHWLQMRDQKCKIHLAPQTRLTHFTTAGPLPSIRLNAISTAIYCTLGSLASAFHLKLHSWFVTGVGNVKRTSTWSIISCWRHSSKESIAM